MDKKIYDLIENMYSEMQQGFRGINEKIEKIDKRQELIYEEVIRIREDMTETRADLKQRTVPGT